MLQRLSAYCRMRLQVESFEEYLHYMCYNLTEHEAAFPTLLAEREDAIRELRGGDVIASDRVVATMQEISGFSHPPHASTPVIRDQAHVAAIEAGKVIFTAQIVPENPEPSSQYRLTSMTDLAEAAEQAEVASQFDAAMAKAAEERRAKQEEREMVTAGATAERPPTLPAKAQRAAEMVRTAAASYVKPVAAPMAPLQLPHQQQTPTLKPKGLPSWMSLPKRK